MQVQTGSLLVAEREAVAGPHAAEREEAEGTSTEKMALESDTEQYEEEEFDTEKTQAVDMLQGLLRKASRKPIRGRRKVVMNSYTKSHNFKASPSYNEPDVLQASDVKNEMFQAPSSDFKPDIFQATDLHQNQDPILESLLGTKPDIIWGSSSGIKPDIFQVKPSDEKQDIFQARVSDQKHNIFQATPSNLRSDDFLSKPSKLNSNPFLAIPLDPNPDIFSPLPSKSLNPDIFQVTRLDTKADIFQPPSSDLKANIFQAPSDLKRDIFQATPTTSKPDLFQVTPSNHIPDPFQTIPLDLKPDIILPSPSNLKPDIFQPTSSNLKPTSSNLRPDIFQATTSNMKQDLFQSTAFSLKANIFQSSPSAMKASIGHGTPSSSELDIRQATVSNQNFNPFQAPTLDPKTEIPFTTTSRLKPEVFQGPPSDLKDIFQPLPSDLKSDTFNALYSDDTEDTSQTKVLDAVPGVFKVIPSDQQPNPFKTTQYDLKQDSFKAMHSDMEDDIFRAPTPDPKKCTFDDSPIYTIQFVPFFVTQQDSKSQDSKCKAIEEDDYPVYENILLIGQEKCVEDWPEDSPELNPDSKPVCTNPKIHLSLILPTLAYMSIISSFQDNYPEDGDIPKGPRSSKVKDYCVCIGEHGYRAFRIFPVCPSNVLFSSFLQQNYVDKAAWGSASKSHRDAKFLDECSETKPELPREGTGDAEEIDPIQHKKGKKFKISFAHHRSSKENIEESKHSDVSTTRRDLKYIPKLEKMPPGATCANYHLSEAAEAEWLSAQQDMRRCSHLEDDWVEEKEKDADNDSLMEWWNSVEQWDNVPLDVKEDLTEEEEARMLVLLADKVQRGIRVFNKVFTEHAEGLYQHIVTLGTIANNICSVHKKAKIANITGGTTTAVGGVAAITGLALAPITFGASLIVTAVGVGVATAGGLTSASAAISDNINVSMDRKKVENVVEDYEAKMADISRCLKFIRMGLEKMQVYSEKRTTWIFHQDWETRQAVQIASLGKEEVAQAVHAVNMIYGELGSLFQGMNSFYGVNDTRGIKKSAKMEFAGKVRDVAQHLQEGLIELNSVREQLQEAIGLV
ncbi:uncharacterized protein LOC108940849 isoform X3 [Arapaima gigas]